MLFSVKELGIAQLRELKQKLYAEKCANDGIETENKKFQNIDEYISDDEVYNRYKDEKFLAYEDFTVDPSFAIYDNKAQAYLKSPEQEYEWWPLEVMDLVSDKLLDNAEKYAWELVDKNLLDPDEITEHECYGALRRWCGYVAESPIEYVEYLFVAANLLGYDLQFYKNQYNGDIL